LAAAANVQEPDGGQRGTAKERFSKIGQVSAVPSKRSVCQLIWCAMKEISMCPHLLVRRSAGLILTLVIGAWILTIATASGVLIADEGIERASAWADLALRWCLT
jgi:hypothetical protein